MFSQVVLDFVILGMDDYPRASPSHTAELHVDLLCWMAFYAKTLKTVSEFLQITSDTEMFSYDQSRMLTTLEEIHWDPKSQSYTDVALDKKGKRFHVVHKGYVSILPLALGLISHKTERLGMTLKMIRDPTYLWSDYGLCSLSKNDEFFGHGENYWRGPVHNLY